jgi:predicted transcriptional regulator
VLTILRNLEEKGFVTHEAEGRAHRYIPQVQKQAARRTALAQLVERLFHGSAEQLVAQLVEDNALTADDLQRLRRLLAAKPAAPPKKGGDR